MNQEGSFRRPWALCCLRCAKRGGQRALPQPGQWEPATRARSQADYALSNLCHETHSPGSQPHHARWSTVQRIERRADDDRRARGAQARPNSDCYHCRMHLTHAFTLMLRDRKRCEAPGTCCCGWDALPSKRAAGTVPPRRVAAYCALLRGLADTGGAPGSCRGRLKRSSSLKSRTMSPWRASARE